MKIAVAQIDLELGNKENNLTHILGYVERASANSSDLVLFPEMCDVGYDMETIVNSPSSQYDDFYLALSVAARTHHITIVIGLSDKREENLFNTVTVFSKDGEISHYYDKMHLFTAEPVREQEFLTAGDHLTLFTEEDLTLGLQICYDIRFPELSRSLALGGAQVLLVSAAWPKVRLEHWQTLLKARAIENQCYVVASNRCGTDAGLTFAGNSIMLSPLGESLEILDSETEGLIYSEINTDLIDTTRATITVFNDRRTGIY